MPRRNSKNMIQQSDRQQKGNQAKQDKLPKMPLYKDRLNLLEAEGDNMICDGDSALSELSDDLEAEEDHHQKAALTCAEYLQQMFPLTFDIDKAIISTVPLTDKISVHSREVTYKGYYKTLGIVCACVTPLNKVDYFDEMNQHEWEMSEQLMPCRNMATCITHFKANQLTTKNSFWYFIKPYYPKGTLTQYWMNNRIQKTTIQPLYILQIAISLFSAIRDAHSLNIGLVDISMETLWLGMDGVAYFSGFKSSLSLQGGSKVKPWINFNILPCPEKTMIKSKGYRQETDVFLACHVILQLMQRSNSSISSLVSIKNGRVEILSKHIDPLYANILPAVEPGLAFKCEDRPSAAAMLGCFESLRYLAFA